MIWSWSHYELYQTCPRKYEKTYLKREYTEPEDTRDNANWGEHVHRAMQAAVETDQPLPDNMKDLNLENKVKILRAMPGTIMVEQKMGLNRLLQPCDFFDKENVWCRAIGDYVNINPAQTVAFTLDYKTGKRKLTDQLKLLALVLFHHYPNLQTVHSGFMWIKLKGKIDTETYHRKDLIRLWGAFIPTLEKMKESHRLDIWPTIRNGLCLKYCPVVSCPYNGSFRG